MTRAKVAATAWQAARFGGVALLLFALDWAVLRGAVAAGADAYVGRAASLSLSMAAGFALNRRFTFRAAGPPTWGEARRYGAAAAAGALVNYGVFAAMVTAGAAHAPAIAAGMSAAALVTFTRFRSLFARA